jgi:hypothetical protein
MSNVTMLKNLGFNEAEIGDIISSFEGPFEEVQITATKRIEGGVFVTYINIRRIFVSKRVLFVSKHFWIVECKGFISSRHSDYVGAAKELLATATANPGHKVHIFKAVESAVVGEVKREVLS